MASVDDRIVQMSFDNKQFESGVSTTLSTLDKLKNALNFSNSKKGLDDLQTSANKFNLGGVGVSIDGISTKLLAWSTIGVTALSNIVTRAIDAGVEITKALTIDPVKAGLTNYETQINAIQTILANTSGAGTTLDQVNSALAELNTYANLTVYNFSEMAKNIGTFTAAGVDLQTSVNAIKGIANLAALSGSSSDQAASAMYQLSQAIAAGQVKLQDWNSVVNAGIGGKVFQEALFNTAKQFGTIKNVPIGETFDQWTAAGNSFRNSLQDGWITSKVLTSTLSQFTGDLTDAQLKSEGYNADQIKQIQALAKTASSAATNIKTLTQLQQALKEEVATAWAAIFKTVFGDINQATTLFSKVHTTLENALTNPIYDLNNLLQATAKLGGRDKVIDALTNAFHAFSAVTKPIAAAFRDIFPAKTAKDLYDLTVRFDNFTKSLIPSAKTIDEIRRTFAGIFAVLDIGHQIVKGVLGVIGDLFDEFNGGPSAILGASASVGDFLVKLDKAIKSGGQLNDFFQKLGKVVQAPVEFIKGIAKAIGDIFQGFNGKAASDVSDSLGRVSDRLEPLKKLFEGVSIAWQGFVSLFGKLATAVQPIVDSFVAAFANLGDQIANAFKTGNFNGIFDVINSVLLGGILVLVKKFFSKGLSVDLGGGLLGSIRESFEGLTGTLKAMETNIKADTLLKIAGAVALLTVSVVALSLIDSDKLTKALGAMAVGFGELLSAMAILVKISGTAGFLKVPIIAASMILLATALDILVLALVALSLLDWDQIEKGLTGIGVLLGELSIAVKPLAANAEGMIAAGAGIILLSTGLKILAGVVADLGKLDVNTLYKGLGAVAAALLAIGAAANLFPPDMVATGAGLVLIAAALKIMVGVIEDLGKTDMDVLYKGIVSIAAAMLAIGAAVNLMPPTLPLIGLGLIGVGTALKIIASAIKTFGSMSWSEIGKGLTTLAGALAELAIALNVMSGTLGGAAALLIAATALGILTPVLVTLGHLSWTAIVKGLVAVAGALAIIGVAGLLVEPVVPALLGLGVAVLALGAGVTLLGAGALLLATAFSLLSTVGTAGVAVLLAAIDGFIQEIPELAKNLAEGLVDVIVTIGDSAPQFVGAFAQVLDAILQAIIQETPEIVKTMGVLLQGLFKVIQDNVPGLIKTGLLIITSLLKGIADNIGQATASVANIIVNFLNALANHLPDIIAAGARVLVALLQGIADHIADAIGAGANIIVNILTGVANKIPDIISAGVDIIVKFLGGIADAIPRVATAAVGVITSFIESIAKQAGPLADAAFNAIIDFLNGLADAIRDNSYAFGQAGGNIAEAIVQGILEALAGAVDSVVHAALNMVKSAWNAVTGFLGIGGPSKLFMTAGDGMAEGIVIGLDRSTNSVSKQATATANAAFDSVSTALATIPDLLDGPINLNPTITPVLDLTNVTKDASQIAGVLAASPLDVDSTLAVAASISTATQATSDEKNAPVDSGPAAPITFEQNNYSPKALSPIEIYRNTKNQLSLAREALNS